MATAFFAENAHPQASPTRHANALVRTCCFAARFRACSRHQLDQNNELGQELRDKPSNPTSLWAMAPCPDGTPTPAAASSRSAADAQRLDLPTSMLTAQVETLQAVQPLATKALLPNCHAPLDRVYLMLESQQLARDIWIELAKNDDTSSKAAGRTPLTLLVTPSGRTFDRECAAYARQRLWEATRVRRHGQRLGLHWHAARYRARLPPRHDTRSPQLRPYRRRRRQRPAARAHKPVVLIALERPGLLGGRHAATLRGGRRRGHGRRV